MPAEGSVLCRRRSARINCIWSPSRASSRPSSCAARHSALDGGVDWLQLRDKSASAAAMFGQARQLLTVVRQHGAHLAINDRLDVALAVGAGGRAPGGAESARRRGRSAGSGSHAGRSLGAQPGRGDSRRRRGRGLRHVRPRLSDLDAPGRPPAWPERAARHRRGGRHSGAGHRRHHRRQPGRRARHGLRGCRRDLSHSVEPRPVRRRGPLTARARRSPHQPRIALEPGSAMQLDHQPATV